jgi:two-component system nitrogen regulation sensor histidine kinase NtrY
VITLKARSALLFLIFILCLGAGLLTAYFSDKPEDEAAVSEKIARHVSRELNRIESELGAIKSGINSPATVAAKISYPFFIYNRDSLVYWSDNRFVPAPLTVADSFDVKLLRTGTEAFLVKKKTLSAQRYVISFIPLQRNYIISNDYLHPEWNTRIFPSGNISILDPGASAGIPICIDNQCLFRILFLTDVNAHLDLRIIALVLILIALAALTALLYKGLYWVSRKHVEFGIPYLYLAFLLLRIGMTELDFPGALIQGKLFDPQLFRSSSLNATLGDLLINVICILAICYYVFRNFFRFTVLYFRENAAWSWLIDILSAVCILFAGLFPFVVIQTLYNNSSITLDIFQSLQFDALRVTAIVIVLLSGICSFLFSHSFIRILGSDRNRIRVGISFLMGIGVFVLVNEYTRQFYLSSLLLTFVFFVTVYAFRLYASLRRLSYATFTYLFICIFCLSVNGAYGIQYFSHKEKIENQFRFANNFLIDRDYFGEYLLNQVSLKIAKDAFTQARITSPFLGKEAIGQKIRQVFLPSYFNKYDVKIHIFNATGNPIDSREGTTLSDIVNRYNEDSFRTSYEGIYFVTNPESDIAQKYLIHVPIERFSSPSGHVVVELSLKKIIPENVYPELLVDYRFQQFYRTQDLSYAVFIGKDILFSSGAYNYEKLFNRSWIGNARLYMQGLSANGHDHIAQEDQNGRIAVVSSPTTPFTYRVANFSFLFVLGLFIILIMIFVQGIVNYFKGSRLFFSARIQLYINLAFFIPLIIVSISTLGLTSLASQQQLGTEYLNKSRIFGQQITSSLNDFVYQHDDSQVSFSNRLADLANLSNLDANVYRPDGKLLATSQPLIFERNLLSAYINPGAYDKVKNGEISFIESEQVGKLHYFVAYTAIKSPQTARLIGILAIPFFQSAYLLEKAQITILGNILNIFAFIFIALLVLSYFVSEWLTFPLRFITQSLRRTSLTRINHPLTWNSNDEIGLMVKEYNSMLYKLSESKNELEHTQREKAWREIAQQVAHEIKNPLTPMKLTLQQLERTLQAGNGTKEKSQKAIAVLLEQVDTLNDIASSFSGFAKMPELVMKEMEIVSAIKRAVDLHSSSGEILFRSSAREIFILGDEQMLNRTFSNIILNGLQSGNPGQAIRIQVLVNKVGDQVRIEFKDNGKGIDPSIADLVFLPHFSTKKSGSGIGLAISKQGIEQMKGKIWFETSPGTGTSFFIDLPVIS